MWVFGLLIIGLISQLVYADTLTVELLTENDIEVVGRARRDVSRMPESLVFKLKRDHEKAILRLTKIPPLTTTVCRGDGQHTINHTREDMATYSDYSRKAVVLVRKNTDSSNGYNMEGHLQMGLRLIHIKPTGDGINHVIVRQETLIHKPSETYSTHEGHRRKRSLRTYTVEVCFIADYQNFFSFIERNDNNVALAEADMRHYYAFIAEKVKVRYHHINQVDGRIAFNVVTSGLVIVEERSKAWFSENFKDGATLDADLALNATSFWYESPPAGIVLPPSDHYMFFTGYDLKRSENVGNAGLAYTATMCIPQLYGLQASSSIVEDHRDGETGGTAAHELGHALNASHDSEVGCNDADAYIMTGRGIVIQDPALAQRPWQFSSCSVRDITAFVERTDVNCLDNNRYGNGIVTSTEIAGQYFDINEQCNMKYGNGSILCSSFYSTDKDKLCYLVLCLRSELNSCSSARSMEFTTCDTNRWCHRGLCIKANNTAPVFINVPTIRIEIPTTAQDGIYTIQTFDPDVEDTLTFHLTWDPVSVSQYFIFNPTTKQVTVNPGLSLTTAALTISNFSLIMYVDDGLLLSLPVNIDFVFRVQVNHPPTFSKQIYTLSVNEGKAGQIIINSLLSSVTDVDSNTVLSFRLLQTTYSAYFAVDSGSGRITYRLDYDYDPVRLPNIVRLTVETRDQTGLTDTANFDLTILNVNQPPAFQNLPASVNLPENTGSGMLIFNVDATDPDSTDSISYSFINPDGFVTKYLVLNSNTGEITFTNSAQLDYETINSKVYQVTVGISSNFHARNQILTITVTNSNEPPIFSQSVFNTTTTTGPAGQEIVPSLTNFVSDPDIGDRIQYAIQPGTYTYLFNIDQSNGRITFAQEYGIDRSIYPKQVSLVVTATDATGLTGSAVFIINVDIQELNSPPAFSQQTYNVTVNEGKAGQIIIASLLGLVNDNDANTVFSFRLLQTSHSSYFAIDLDSGKVAYLSDYDYDPVRLPNFVRLTVETRDETGLTATANFDLTILNVNQPPVFQNLPASVNLPENTASGIFIFNVDATDPDSTDSISYSFINPDGFVTKYLVLNSNTGEITFANNVKLDYETINPKVYQVPIRISNQFHSLDQILTIHVTNSNEPPVFSQSTFTKTTSSGPAGQEIVPSLTSFVSDPDIGDRIRYGIQTGNYTYLFNIDQSNGRITFAQEYGTNRSIYPEKVSLVVTATDTASLVASAVYIILVDVPNRSPTISNLPNTVNVPENTPARSPIYNVQGQDLDGEPIVYSLVSSVPSSQNYFIVSPSGEVSVASGVVIDYETLPSTIYLTITASDGSVASNPANLTVTITNVNEPPRFNQTEYSFTVNEGKAGDVLIPSLVPYVIDPDQGDSFTFSIESSTHSIRFNINQISGAIRFSSDYDTDPLRLPNQVELNVRVRDAGNNVARSTIRFSINNVNKAPLFTNLPNSVKVPATTIDGAVVFTVAVTDVDSQDILNIQANLTMGTASQYLTFIQADRTLRFSGGSSITRNETYIIRFTVSDGSLSVSESLTVDVYAQDTVCSAASWSEGCNNDGCDYKASWMLNEVTDIITFNLEAKLGDADRWFGIGFSNDLFMPNSDAIIGWYANGQATVKDVWMSSRSVPSTDGTQSVTDISGSFENGLTKLTFSRARNTGDASDVQFNDLDCYYFFYVRGGNVNTQTGSYSYHSINRPVKSASRICIQTCSGTTTQNPPTTARPFLITNLPMSMSVSENIACCSAIYTARTNAVDTSKVTFQLQQVNTGIPTLFTINAGGSIHVKAGVIIDYETLPSNIYLTITASDGSVASNPANLTVTITNVNEPPRFNQTEYSFTVNEGKVGQVLVASFLPYVADPDRGETFSFSRLSVTPYFNVDQSTGAISFAADYDTDPTRLSNQVSITLRVEDSGDNVHTTTVRLIIVNVNQAPSFTNLPGTIDIPVTTISGVVFTVSTSDPDSTDVLAVDVNYITAGASQYFIFSNTDKSLLFIGRQTLVSSQSFAIRFTVSDGKLSVSENLDVTVLINPPTTTPRQLVITNLPVTIPVLENIASGTTIHNVTTNEVDINKVTFQLQQINTAIPILLAINNSGVVYVRSGAVIDYETLPSPIYFTITANDGSVSSNPANLTVTITNVNEPPIFNQSLYSFTVNEGKLGDMVIGSLLPYVADQDRNEVFNFSLIPSTFSDRFNIDQSTGSISFAADSRGLPNQVQLSVVVLDGGLLFHSTSITLSINELNRTPYFTNLPATLSNVSNAVDNKVIYTVMVSDSNPGDTLTISVKYITAGASQFFRYNYNDKTITFTGGASLTTSQAFVILFTVSDGLMSSSARFTVEMVVDPVITTAAPSAVSFNQSSYSFTVEDGIAGHIIIQSLIPYVIDASQSGNLKFTLIPTSYSQYFNIDQSNGAISFALNYDSSQLPKVVNLTVVVFKNNIRLTTSTFSLTIYTSNRAPEFLNLPGSVTISGTILPGAKFFNVKTLDKDGNVGISVRMDHVNADSRTKFEFNNKTMDMYIAAGAVFTSSEIYNLDFIVSDGRLSTSAILTIIVKVVPETTRQPNNPTTLPTPLPTPLPTDSSNYGGIFDEPWSISSTIIGGVLIPAFIIFIVCIICKYRHKPNDLDYTNYGKP